MGIMNNLSERNALVEDNIGLVYMVAQKFVGRGVEFDDIVQIGTIGLIKAGDRFNEEFNVKFSTQRLLKTYPFYTFCCG